MHYVSIRSISMITLDSNNKKAKNSAYLVFVARLKKSLSLSMRSVLNLSMSSSILRISASNLSLSESNSLSNTEKSPRRLMGTDV